MGHSLTLYDDGYTLDRLRGLQSLVQQVGGCSKRGIEPKGFVTWVRGNFIADHSARRRAAERYSKLCSRCE